MKSQATNHRPETAADSCTAVRLLALSGWRGRRGKRDHEAPEDREEGREAVQVVKEGPCARARVPWPATRPSPASRPPNERGLQHSKRQHSRGQPRRHSGQETSQLASYPASKANEFNNIQ